MKMKKTLLLIAILSLFLVSCKTETISVKETTVDISEEETEISNQPIASELDGIWIETEYEKYKVGISEINVTWKNSLDDTIMFGDPFTIEKKVGDEWNQVIREVDSNPIFSTLGYQLDAYESMWHNYILIPYTEGLSQGDYRICIVFYRITLDGVDYGSGNYPKYFSYGYFNVGKDN